LIDVSPPSSNSSERTKKRKQDEIEKNGVTSLNTSSRAARYSRSQKKDSTAHEKIDEESTRPPKKTRSKLKQAEEPIEHFNVEANSTGDDDESNLKKIKKENDENLVRVIADGETLDSEVKLIEEGTAPKEIDVYVDIDDEVIERDEEPSVNVDMDDDDVVVEEEPPNVPNEEDDDVVIEEEQDEVNMNTSGGEDDANPTPMISKKARDVQNGVKNKNTEQNKKKKERGKNKEKEKKDDVHEDSTLLKRLSESEEKLKEIIDQLRQKEQNENENGTHLL
jgi:hypothetical protein